MPWWDCICGHDEEPTEPPPKIDEFWMVAVTVPVDSFSEWFEAASTDAIDVRRQNKEVGGGRFKEFEDVDHEGLGIVKSFVGHHEPPPPTSPVAGLWQRVHKPGGSTALCVHVFHVERLAAVRAALAGKPYEGGATVWSRVASEVDYDALDAADTVVSTHHGVREFAGWLETYVRREREGDFTYLRVAKTLIGEVQPGCAGAHAVHVLARDSLCHLDLDFDAPPYVGGEDLVKRGDVLRPWGATTAALKWHREAPRRDVN